MKASLRYVKQGRRRVGPSWENAMRRSIAALALALVVASASAEEVSDNDRFKLWNACRPMDLLVEHLGQDAADIGLTRDDIQTAVRSRLRAARLYDADASILQPYLYVNVNVVGHAHSISFRYKKEVRDPRTDLSREAVTWQLGGLGTHYSGDKNYILNFVSRHTDRFIDEYLRVNADACQ